MPTWRGDGLRRWPRLSPVSIQTSRPSACSSRTACGDSGLSVSATAISAGALRRPRPRTSASCPAERQAPPPCVGLARSGRCPAAASRRALPSSSGVARRRSRDTPARRPPGSRWPAGWQSPARRRAAHDRLAQRVLGAALGRWRRAAAGRPRRTSPGAQHVRDRGLPRVSVPVLSSTMRVDPVGALQRLAAADQHAVLGALAGADHDRGRRRQAQRAGAGDDQHGDEGDEREGEARLRADDEPHRRRSARPAPAPPARSRTRSRRPGAGSAPSSPAPPRPSGRSAPAAVSLPTRVARKVKEPVLLSVAPITASPGGLLHRQALAGQHRLVHRGRAARPAPSTGTLSPGRTRRTSPATTCRQGHIDFSVAAHDTGRAGARPISFLIASPVWPLARASR